MMASRKEATAPRVDAGQKPTRNSLRHHSKEASRAVKIDFDAGNRAALAALPAILARLVPGGRVMGREYSVLNPRRADRRPGSFKVRVFGTSTGRWADFATGDKGGDTVSLAAYLENCSQTEAVLRLARVLGARCGHE